MTAHDAAFTGPVSTDQCDDVSGHVTLANGARPHCSGGTVLLCRGRLTRPFSPVYIGIAVATDYTVRFATTRAIPTSCATDGTNFLLRDVILRHGAPRKFLIEQGRYFLSQVVNGILCFCSTKHELSTAYHPQTNGLTERRKWTLTDMLSMYVSADH